ncbi:MAG: hypothetical protein ACR2M5_09410 [Nakamurella sp.]
MEMTRRRAARRPAGPPNQVAGTDTEASSSSPSAPVAPKADVALEDEAARVADGSAHDRNDGEFPPRRRQRAAKSRSGAGSDQDPATEPEPAVGQPPSASPSRRNDRPGGESTAQERRRGESVGKTRYGSGRGESAMERSLRALVTLRSTQLSPNVAMRAREVADPTAADLAAADRDLVLVRRHYVPPTPLTTSKRSDQSVPGRESEQRGRAESRRGGRKPQRGSGSGV